MADDEDEWLPELLGRRPAASASGVLCPILLGSPSRRLPVTCAPSVLADDDEATQWLRELLSRRYEVPSAGVASSVPVQRRQVISDSVVSPQRPLSTIVPPTMVEIVRERDAREAAQEKQAERNQRARWDLALIRRSSSPRREHRTSQTDSQRCSSRSRSPGVCEELGRQETLGVGGVSWEYYCPERDPPRDVILAKSEAAIRATYFPPSTMGPRFYVGVSRYLQRRWFGDASMDGHISQWRAMHILGLFSSDVGQAEDNLITTLKKRYNKWCANIRGGGGGSSSRRPSFLYICIHRLD